MIGQVKKKIGEYLPKIIDATLKTFGIDLTPDADQRTIKKGVLASMTASTIQFRWKDFSVEQLAAFRRYLLAGFESYSKAWMFITRLEYFNIQKIKQELEDLLNEHGRDAKLLQSAGAAQAGAGDEVENMARILIEEWSLVEPQKGFGLKDVHNLL